MNEIMGFIYSGINDTFFKAILIVLASVKCNDSIHFSYIEKEIHIQYHIMCCAKSDHSILMVP